MENNMEIIAIIQFLLLCAFIYGLYKKHRQVKHYEKKYSKIIDVEQEVIKLTTEKSSIGLDIEKLRSDYKEKRAIFNSLVKEAAIYDEEIQLAELGFYKPHFDFGTSEDYKEEIASIRSKQKKMVKDKNAIFCNKEWSVEGSKAKGRTMTNRGIRLTARAFNNECDAAISNTSWSNVDRMEERIERAFSAINKLNESNAIHISGEYLKLKVNELRLAHEYKEKKQQEKEEQAEIRRQMREEAKLEQEMERALKDEDKYQKLLEKAKLDAEKVTGDKLDTMKEKIEKLRQELAAAHEKSERAKSMAEQTKIGHIYIISNIGSFGENVYKIGMTRRLEPIDRVKELGDASVPFVFDIHAMIYSEDAPALENALHKSFTQKRVNLVNNRKEFFNVDLAEISDEVRKISPDADFVETAEARDFMETRAILAQRNKLAERIDTQNEFPAEL